MKRRGAAVLASGCGGGGAAVPPCPRGGAEAAGRARPLLGPGLQPGHRGTRACSAAGDRAGAAPAPTLPGPALLCPAWPGQETPGRATPRKQRGGQEAGAGERQQETRNHSAAGSYLAQTER